jgi:hypothetical protein
MQFTIDGNASLQDQEITLNHTEKQGVLKLVSYIRSTPAPPAPPAPGSTATAPVNTHVNLATFEDRDITVILPHLSLSEVSGGAPSPPAGNELVFVSDIWVSGVIKKVAGIR